MATRVDGVAAAVRERPLAVVLGAIAVAAIVRAAEVLAGVHLTTGALVVSTTLVLLAGAAFVRTDAVPTGELRPSPVEFRRAVAIGVVGVGAVQVAGTLLQVAVLRATGRQPRVVLFAENPATLSTSPAQIGVYMAFGVVLVAVGQELLFRGALLGVLARRLGFWRANGVQAGIFGLWHLAWPVAVSLMAATPAVPLPVYAAGTVLVTALTGAVLGAFVLATATLWTAVFAHLLHNLSILALHVRTPDGVVHGSVRSPVLVAGYVGLAGLAHLRWGECVSWSERSQSSRNSTG